MTRDIALPPIHISETTKFTVEADYELTQALRRYQAFYREVYGETVPEADLLREMARRFMASDKHFQQFGVKKRRTRKKPSTAERPKSAPADQFHLNDGDDRKRA